MTLSVQPEQGRGSYSNDEICEMRVVFIGTNGVFTRNCLNAVARNFSIAAIVESAPRRTENWLDKSVAFRAWVARALGRFSLFGWAKARKIPFFRLTKTNSSDLVAFLKKRRPDVGCVASMSQLLRKEAFEVPRFGFINCHPSSLPHYRGPNSWFWQYYHMERKIGITVHFIDEGEDTGDILKQDHVALALGEEIEVVVDRVSCLGGKLMVDALDDIEAGTVQSTRQNDLACPFRARNTKSNEQLIEWADWPIQRVWHVLRGSTLRVLAGPAGLRRGFQWKIGSYCLGVCDDEPGSIARDSTGFYVAHPQGKVRLSPKFKLGAWMHYWFTRRGS